MIRVFANGPGDRDLIPGRVIPKIQKMIFMALMEYSKEKKYRFLLHLSIEAIERELADRP